MTKQELINTYDSMSMPEEHVEAIEARLKKLYDNPSPSSAPEVPEESTREYKFDRKKPSAVKAAVISISAAAAAVLLVFGGRYLINGLPISSDPPLDAETEETSEPPYDTEEIRFESADDIPGYERAGCYDEYEHSLIPGADSGKAGPLFTQRLRDGKPVSVVRIKITSANSWDEMNYTEYHAVITECLSGKQLNLNISNEVTFRLGSTHSEQIIGEPSLAVGDELIAAAAEDGGEKSLVDPEELLFECFTVKGRNFAAQRHWYWLDLADNAFNHQHGDIRRPTTVTDDPVSYYGVYEQGELAAALEKLVLASDEALSLGTEPLPGLYSDFTLDFGLIEPFCYYWFDENNELISIDARKTFSETSTVWTTRTFPTCTALASARTNSAGICRLPIETAATACTGYQKMIRSICTDMISAATVRIQEAITPSAILGRGRAAGRSSTRTTTAAFTLPHSR